MAKQQHMPHTTVTRRHNYPTSCRRRRRVVACLFIVVVFAAFAMASVDAARPPQTGDASTIKLSRSKLYRWRQKFVRNRCHHHATDVTSSTKSRGSMLTLQRPTSERLGQWFWGTRGKSSNTHDVNNCDSSIAFNHDSVGMTNPCLHIQPASPQQQQPHDTKTTLVSTKSTTTTFLKQQIQPSSSSSSNDDDDEKLWWPDTACGTVDRSWKVLKFHRCQVGRGLDCYQRVRDAALAWEFESSTHKGIRTVVRPEPQQQGQRHHYNNNGYAVLPASVQQIWSGPGRRLVTFTSVPLLPSWLTVASASRGTSTSSSSSSRLYCCNPVHVVYDVVDQPAANAGNTIFSSTAYATGRGHWLRGEERVTVVLRDGGRVDVELLSYSKPGKSVMGRLVWRLGVGRMQQSFFEEQMSALEQVAREAAPPRGAASFFL